MGVLICKWSTPMGNCIGILGTYDDITEAKFVENEIRQLSVAVEQSPNAVVITDPSGNIEYINRTFSLMTGYSKDELMGQNPRILKSGEQSKEFYDELWQTISDGQNWEGIFVNKKKNGDLYQDETTIAPLKDSSGVITNYVAIKRDVTEEKKREHELNEAHRMESVGVLAGGIAHQFNNILQAILGYTELLSVELEDAPDLQKKLEQIQVSTHRAAELTKQLLTFSKKDFMLLAQSDINKLIRQVIDDYKDEIPENITVEFLASDNLEKVSVDERQLRFMFNNMFDNACDAMPEGGNIKVTTSYVSITTEDVSSITNACPGNFVCISIEDTGVGISDEGQKHLFEPFYSTKDLGTGLGLASTYGIVQKHNGWINVKSNLGKGSVFRIYIPVSEQ